MTVASYAYGTSEDVAGYTPRYAAASGDFDTTTNPTQARVEGMINRTSSIINAFLSDFGFNVPLTSTQGVNIMTELVMEYVTELIEGIRGSGRFAPNSKQIGGRSKWTLISSEIYDFLDNIATGLEDMGETRTDSTIAGLSYRDSDERGNETSPMFQRSGFGNAFTDWDST
jgi:hypothetical protein